MADCSTTATTFSFELTECSTNTFSFDLADCATKTKNEANAKITWQSDPNAFKTIPNRLSSPKCPNLVLVLGIGQLFYFTQELRNQKLSSNKQYETQINCTSEKKIVGNEKNKLGDIRPDIKAQRSLQETAEYKSGNDAQIEDRDEKNYGILLEQYHNDDTAIREEYEIQLREIDVSISPKKYRHDWNEVGTFTNPALNNDNNNLKFRDETRTSKGKSKQMDRKQCNRRSFSTNLLHLNVKQSECLQDSSQYDESRVTGLDGKHWMTIDASLFAVRGKTYLSDGIKVPSCPSLLRLITVDFVEVSEPMLTGFCSHPKEMVQKWLSLEKKKTDEGIVEPRSTHTMPEFVFCVNMIIPGPPHYHFLLYFAVDDLSRLGIQRRGLDSTISRTSESQSNLLNDFFFGPSDELRNKTLKMITRIVKGNIFLKAAVGSKPMILGKTLKQSFIKSERFLEVIIDLGTSTMTDKLLKLATAYGSEIIAEFGFLLEGNIQSNLPENIIGAVRLQNRGFDGKIRFVEKE